MAEKSSLLWLGLAVTLVCQGYSQHWSYGLRPGGREELMAFRTRCKSSWRSFRNWTPQVCPSCSDLSPHITLSSLKELLAKLADREIGRKNI